MLDRDSLQLSYRDHATHSSSSDGSHSVREDARESPLASKDGSPSGAFVSRRTTTTGWATSQPAGSTASYQRVKRCIDITVPIVALIGLMPVFLLIALILVIDDPGPIFFTQLRVGKNGRKFRFYKFRSMVKNAADLQASLIHENEASGPIFKMRGDPRVTRVGRVLRKYSLDELPQLINVLRGDMSLVGPRPHLPSEVDKYTDRQRQRLTVQPGLVCFREIHGRSDLTFERWIELDLHYIACRSLRTDMQILLRLIPAVIGGRGAY